MIELSMHIMDIVENAVRAEANKIYISINENTKKDAFSIEIKDNGRGMNKKMQKKAFDPFITTKPEKKIGLGLSLLKAAAKRCGGDLIITSSPGKGTKVKADFVLSHIDRQPLGNIVETIVVLITGNPEVEFIFLHKKNGESIKWCSSRITKNVGNKIRTSPEVINFVKEDFRKIYINF